jgi:hypothetical protein
MMTNPNRSVYLRDCQFIIRKHSLSADKTLTLHTAHDSFVTTSLHDRRKIKEADVYPPLVLR